MAAEQSPAATMGVVAGARADTAADDKAITVADLDGAESTVSSKTMSVHMAAGGTAGGAGAQKDYAQLAEEYGNQKALSSASAKPTEVKCTVCSLHVVTQMFLPCEHICCCDMCITALGICPKGGAGGGWSACPLCMNDIQDIRPIQDAAHLQRVYGPSTDLPSGFNDKFRQSKDTLLSKSGAVEGRGA